MSERALAPPAIWLPSIRGGREEGQSVRTQTLHLSNPAAVPERNCCPSGRFAGIRSSEVSRRPGLQTLTAVLNTYSCSHCEGGAAGRRAQHTVEMGCMDPRYQQRAGPARPGPVESQLCFSAGEVIHQTGSSGCTRVAAPRPTAALIAHTHTQTDIG